MKRCPNPSCESDFLYGNERTVCPFCHSTLVSTGAAAPNRPTVLPIDQLLMHPAYEEDEDAPFTVEGFGHITCRGRIVEIDRQELFLGKFHKFANALFRGEPYQLAHQTIEYTIRVENLSEGLANEVTDFCLYGNYLGRLQVGDEVDIRARSRGNRRILTSIYNRTTSSAIRPGFQIPAWAIRTGVVFLLLSVCALICEIVALFTSGAIVTFSWAILNALMPILIMIGGFWLLFRNIIPRRRRR